MDQVQHIAAPARMQLRGKDAHELSKIWQAYPCADGKIPDGFIGRLGAKVEEFVRNNRNDNSGVPLRKRVEPNPAALRCLA
jgi:hypothetical protein